MYKRIFKEAKYEYNPKLFKTKDIQNFLKTKDLNGYRFVYFEDGIYSFQRKEDNGKYSLVEVSQEQLYNGDLEFMLLHGMTIDSNRKRKEIQKYRRNFKEARKFSPEFQIALKKQDTQAGAAETLGNRMSMNPEVIWKWGKEHNIDLLMNGHILIKDPRKFLDAVLSNRPL